MEYIINTCYGGFRIKEEILDTYRIPRYDWDKQRTDKRLISRVKNGENIGSLYSDLKVVNIPDDATDWRLIEYDGIESIIAVVNGRIVDVF